MPRTANDTAPYLPTQTAPGDRLAEATAATNRVLGNHWNTLLDLERVAAAMFTAITGWNNGSVTVEERDDAKAAYWFHVRGTAESAVNFLGAVLDEVAGSPMFPAPAGGWGSMRAAALAPFGDTVLTPDGGKLPERPVRADLQPATTNTSTTPGGQPLPHRVLHAVRSVMDPSVDWQAMGARCQADRLDLFPHLMSADVNPETRSRAAWLTLEAMAIQRGALVARFRETLAHPEVVRVTHGHPSDPDRWTIYKRDTTSPTGVLACGSLRRGPISDALLSQSRHAPVTGGRGLR